MKNSVMFLVASSFVFFGGFSVALAKDKHPTHADLAHADLKDASGKTVGTVSLAQTPKGVLLTIHSTSLPVGTHGIHFHENGKCEGPDFKSAGGHYGAVGPTGPKEHGLDNPKGPHSGDLPNLEITAPGDSTSEMTTDRVTLKKGPNSLFKEGGTAIVVHAKMDDQKTSPSGNSGDRIACGVITRGK